MIVTKLYETIAEELSITTIQLQDLLTKGYPLVQMYYEHKYNWNSKTEDAPW